MIIYLIQQIGNCGHNIYSYDIPHYDYLVAFFSTTWVTVSPWVECLVPRRALRTADVTAQNFSNQPAMVGDP